MNTRGTMENMISKITVFDAISELGQLVLSFVSDEILRKMSQLTVKELRYVYTFFLRDTNPAMEDEDKCKICDAGIDELRTLVKRDMRHVDMVNYLHEYNYKKELIIGLRRGDVITYRDEDGEVTSKYVMTSDFIQTKVINLTIKDNIGTIHSNSYHRSEILFDYTELNACKTKYIGKINNRLPRLYDPIRRRPYCYTTIFTLLVGKDQADLIEAGKREEFTIDSDDDDPDEYHDHDDEIFYPNY